MAQQAQQAQRWLEGPLGSHGAGCGQDGRSPGLTSAISEGDKSSAAAEGVGVCAVAAATSAGGNRGSSGRPGSAQPVDADGGLFSTRAGGGAGCARRGAVVASAVGDSSDAALEWLGIEGAAAAASMPGELDRTGSPVWLVGCPSVAGIIEPCRIVVLVVEHGCVGDTVGGVRPAALGSG